jgi:hypothetical protein
MNRKVVKMNGVENECEKWKQIKLKYNMLVY